MPELLELFELGEIPRLDDPADIEREHWVDFKRLIKSLD